MFCWLGVWEFGWFALVLTVVNLWWLSRCPLMTYQLASKEVGAAALDERRMPATCYGASTVG